MTKEEFEGLAPGDIVRHKMDKGNAYIVHSNYGRRATAVRTADITNPAEWEIEYKCQLSEVRKRW